MADNKKKALDLEDFSFFLTYAIAPIKEVITDIKRNGGDTGNGASSEQMSVLEKRVDEAQQNIVILALGLSVQQGAAVEGMAGNIVIETFNGTSGYIISSGTYDTEKKRIYA